MPSNRDKNFGYWKNRAQTAENTVERQNNIIADQTTHIDRLTSELEKLRIDMNKEFNIGGG